MGFVRQNGVQLQSQGVLAEIVLPLTSDSILWMSSVLVFFLGGKIRKNNIGLDLILQLSILMPLPVEILAAERKHH